MSRKSLKKRTALVSPLGLLYFRSMLEPLEGRRLFSIDTSSVALYSAEGTPTTINRHLAQWIVVHGDNMNESLMTDMAQAVQAQLDPSQWQVVIVDWSKLASSKGNSSLNAIAVGDRVAAMYKAARIPASRINLIGFSMGGTVINRIAKDFKTSSTEVNRIVGVDPAVGRYEGAVFAQDSAYSICFAAHDTYGGDTGSFSATDAVLLTNLNTTNQLYLHSDTFTVVTTMWQRDAGTISSGDDTISPLFSINQILDGPAPEWKKNVYLSGYDAEMSCGYQSGLYNNLGPLSLSYYNSQNHLRILT